MQRKGCEFTVSGLRWHLNPDFAQSPVGRMLAAGTNPLELPHKTIKATAHRRVVCFESNGFFAYLKQHFCSTLTEGLSSRFAGSRAKAEWDALEKMRSLGFAVPHPLAYAQGTLDGQLTSMLLTGAIKDARNLRELLESLSAEGRLRMLSSLGAELRTLHNRGVYHRDMQPGNFFGKPLDTGFKFYFLDLHKAVFGAGVSSRRRIRDIGQLVFNLGTMCSQSEIEAFLRSYMGGAHGTRFLQRVTSRARKLRGIRKKSRARRCLKTGTHFMVEHEGKARIYRRRDVNTSDVLAAVEKHRATGKSAGAVETGGGTFYVKRIESVSLWQNFKDMFQRPRGRRAWHAANALLLRQIPVPRPLALVEEFSLGRLKRSYLVSKYLESTETLARYIHRNFVQHAPQPGQMSTLLRDLAAALAKIYNESIYHGDLKASNILVAQKPGGPVQFFLTDFDGIQLWRRPNHSRVAKNLVQLYCSVPFCVARPVAARFFLRFLRETGLTEKMKWRLPQIQEKAERRRQKWISVVRKYGKIL